MQLGLVGLGRMGGNMRERLRAAGHEVVGYDHHPEVSDVASAAELVEKLASPRVVWIMVPAQVTESTIDEVAAHLGEGDIVIDGGNSRFSGDPPRAERLGKRGIGYGYVATLGSHRVATDAPLVRAGASAAVVRTTIVHNGRELLVELSIEPGRGTRARLGHSPVAKVRDVLGALRLVLFAPGDLAIVRGDPAERRRYLDELVVARSPRFAAVRADYERVLKQRAALLKSAAAARRSG